MIPGENSWRILTNSSETVLGRINGSSPRGTPSRVIECTGITPEGTAGDTLGQTLGRILEATLEMLPKR